MNFYLAMHNGAYFTPLAGPFESEASAREAAPYLRVLIDATCPDHRTTPIEAMVFTSSEPGPCNPWLGLPR